MTIDDDRWTTQPEVVDLVLALLPLRIRAAGFPTATHAVFTRQNYDGFTLVPDLVLHALGDELGTVASADHAADRSPADGPAFDGLAAASLGLDRVASLDDRIDPQRDEGIISPYDTTFWFVDKTSIPDHEGCRPADEDVTPNGIAASLARDPEELAALEAELEHAIEELAEADERRHRALAAELATAIREDWPTAVGVDISIMNTGEHHLFVLDAIHGPDGQMWPDDEDREEVEYEFDLTDFLSPDDADIEGWIEFPPLDSGERA